MIAESVRRYGETADDRIQHSGYFTDTYYTATAVMEHGDDVFNHTPSTVVTSLDPRDSLYRLSAMDNGTDPTVQQVIYRIFLVYIFHMIVKILNI